MLESLLSDLEKFLGLRAIKGSGQSDGFWILTVLGDHKIWVKDINPGVLFKSTIGAMVSSPNENFFMYLMKANFLGQGTGGSVISLSPDEKFLTLTNLIPYEVNYRIFRDKLEDFVNYLEYWKGEIKKTETRQLS